MRQLRCAGCWILNPLEGLWEAGKVVKGLGASCPVTKVPRVYQCAEIARMARGLPSFTPRARQARVCALSASAFVGLP